MSDPKKPVEKTAAEEPSFTKYGVECGGPEEKKPAGSKEASESCGDCGTKHDSE